MYYTHGGWPVSQCPICWLLLAFAFRLECPLVQEQAKPGVQETGDSTPHPIFILSLESFGSILCPHATSRRETGQ